MSFLLIAEWHLLESSFRTVHLQRRIQLQVVIGRLLNIGGSRMTMYVGAQLCHVESVVA